MVEINGGATTSFGYEVYIVRSGKSITFATEVASLYAASRNDSAYGVNLKWEAEMELSIEYFKARHVDQVKTIPFGNDTISITLKPGIIDSSAPPGGMLYNLNKS